MMVVSDTWRAGGADGRPLRPLPFFKEAPNPSTETQNKHTVVVGAHGHVDVDVECHIDIE